MALIRNPDFLTEEPFETYRENASRYLSSHALADFRKSPLLYWKKKSGLIPDDDRPAYVLGRAAHKRILEGNEAYLDSYAIGGPIDVAIRALNEKPDNIDLGEAALEIWYRPNRDAPQTAVSKLYTAIHEYYGNGNCAPSSCAVIGNLFCDDWLSGSDWHSESDMMFAIVLNVHDEVLEDEDLRERNGT